MGECHMAWMPNVTHPEMTRSATSPPDRPRMTAADTSTIPRNVEGPSTQLCLLWKPAMFPYATLRAGSAK